MAFLSGERQLSYTSLRGKRKRTMVGKCVAGPGDGRRDERADRGCGEEHGKVQHPGLVKVDREKDDVADDGGAGPVVSVLPLILWGRAYQNINGKAR